jgi:hypothetical protein
MTTQRLVWFSLGVARTYPAFNRLATQATLIEVRLGWIHGHEEGARTPAPTTGKGTAEGRATTAPGANLPVTRWGRPGLLPTSPLLGVGCNT